MTIPGFGAELSLYSPTDLYQVRTILVSSPGRHAIQPQISGFRTGGGALEAMGCQFICIPSRNSVSSDCFWYCPGHVPLLTHPTEGLQ
jgi:hypothetical protein